MNKPDITLETIDLASIGLQHATAVRAHFREVNGERARLDPISTTAHQALDASGASVLLHQPSGADKPVWVGMKDDGTVVTAAAGWLGGYDCAEVGKVSLAGDRRFCANVADEPDTRSDGQKESDRAWAAARAELSRS